MLNKNALIDYIYENFTLDGTSRRLVVNAIEYAIKQNAADHEIINTIIFLVDDIGIEEDEIRQFFENAKEEKEMKQLTVQDLKVECDTLIAKGLGDKKVLISQDDEINGYHALWWGFDSDLGSIKEAARYDLFHDNDNPEDVVLLA